MIYTNCRDCGDGLELTHKQINFQRLVRARREYVLCDKCDVAALEKKWERHVHYAAKASGHRRQEQQQKLSNTAKIVRRVLRKSK